MFSKGAFGAKTVILRRGGGEVRAEKTIFFSNFSQKCLKTPFLACFFINLSAAQKFWSKWGLYSDLGELQKINLVDLKKRSTNLRHFFENSPPPPPRENPRSAPGSTLIK